MAGFQDDLDPDDAIPNTANTTVGQNVEDTMKRSDSLSSIENEIIKGKKTLDSEEIILNEEVSEITADELDTWLSTDSKWRRSPEGGEDSNHSSSIPREGDDDDDNSVSLASSSVHLELLEPKQPHISSGSSSPVAPREKKKNRHKEKVIFLEFSFFLL